MGFGNFIGLMAVVVVLLVAAVQFSQRLLGEVFAIGAIVLAAFAIDAVLISWPPTGDGGIGIAITIVIAFTLSGWAHYTCVNERRKAWPDFKIEIVGIVYIFQSLRPIQRDVWLPVRIRNEGAPSSIKDRCVCADFWPNVGFRLPNGQILKPHIELLGGLGPDGTTSVWSDTTVIANLGQLAGWLGVGVQHAPTLEMGTTNEKYRFAGIRELTLSCCDHSDRWFSLTISSSTVSYAENNCLINEVFLRAGIEA